MRHNILIVDDEQLIRQGLRARIEYLGIDVDEMFEADNGLMALGIQDAHPDRSGDHGHLHAGYGRAGTDSADAEEK